MTFNIAEMRQKAEEGLCPSQCVLGLCYLYGIEVEINYKEAFRFLSAAAGQGASRAILNLGRMYAQGLGVNQNGAEAIRHFEAAAKPSDGADAFPARIELGRLFSQGIAVPIERNLAAKWYVAALEIATEDDDPEKIVEARHYTDT